VDAGVARWAAPEPTDPVTDLSIAVYVPPSSAISKSVQRWVDLVEERTGGTIRAQISYSASLLAAEDTLEGVATDRADGGLVGGVYYENQLPLTSITGVPYFTNHPMAAMQSLSELYETHPALRAEYDAHGVVPVFFLPASAPLLGARSQSITSIDELRDRSVRSTGVLTSALSAVDARPAAISFTDLYEALERGVVDAYSGVLLDSVVNAGLYEVAPFVSDPGIGVFSTYPVVIRRSVWESMPPDVRDVVRQAGSEALQAYSDFEETSFAEACSTIRDEGGSVTVWSGPEQQRWQETAGAAALEGWRDRVGEAAADFERAYVRALDRHRGVPRTDNVLACAERFR
jgi:TRAP-type C4-dicarboxylate transport system substrate-binding protein